MLTISLVQYDLVSNVFSLVIAVMGGATLFFFLQRAELAPRYRVVATLAGIVTLTATYNYARLLGSWAAAFSPSHGALTATLYRFNETYRYADWLLTVPLLLIMLVLVIDLPRRQAQIRCFVLGLQAAEMILLGYPGQISTDATTRWAWWGAAMVPFAIIIYQLYVTLAKSVRAQPEEARHLIVAARFLTVMIWCTYPVIYLLPMFGYTGAASVVLTQVGYAAADVAAKAVYGVMIYLIAARKSVPAVHAVASAPVAERPRVAA